MPTTAPTIDRTKREHIGSFARMIWSSREDQHIIAAVNHSENGTESIVAGPGDPDWFVRGQQYRFFGRWEESERGPRFRFQTCTRDTPLTRNAVCKYLADVAPNVGRKTAERLWERYGPDAVRVLREEPGRVSEDRIMSLDNAVEASQELAAGAAMERTRIELFDLLGGRGFHGKMIAAAIKKWKVGAPEIISKNPFRLLTAKLPSAGFKRCDKLWVDLRLPKHALKRQALCAWNIIRTNRDGNTWHKAEDVANELKKQIESRECQPKQALRLALRARLLAKHKDAAGQVWLAETKKAANEQRIADNVKRLLRTGAPILWPDTIPVSQVEGDGLPSAHQRDQLRAACLGAVGLFTGGPGTGKTHTLAFMLQQIVEQWGQRSVGVCAPTGKAAVRATQSLQSRGLSLRATTIHTLLGIGRNGHDGDGWDFNYNAGNPLPYRFLIVDESSMIDTDLKASLLEACADGTHVLFVGDPYQLPPVGHGAPMRDLIAAGIPTGELTQVRRNAGMIVHACLRIKNGEQFDTCSKIDLDANPPQNLRLIEADSPQAAADTLEAVLTSMRSFNPVWQTQVLTPLNKKSLLSRVVLNQRLHPLMNPDGRACFPNPFRVGDKVICLKNSWMNAVELIDDDIDQTEPQNYSPVPDPNGDGDSLEVYVANGEIGRVEAVGPSVTIARFSEGEHCIKIPMKSKSNRMTDEAAGGSADSIDDGDGGSDSDEKGAGGDFDLAYAITGHKSQGSEWPCVIVMIDDQAGMVATREYVYTVLSRGAKLTILIGSKAVLQRQAKRQSLVRRKTMLVELLTAEKAQ